MIGRLIIVSGPPGSGKSTVARGIAEAWPESVTLHLHSDDHWTYFVKGYIPPWDGADFPDLVKDRHEFEEWVKDGNIRRFKTNPIAMHFLRGAAIHMPEYERFLKPGDLDAIWAYVQWLRGSRPTASPRPVSP